MEGSVSLYCARSPAKSKDIPSTLSYRRASRLAGVILADQVRTLDWRARNAEVVASLPTDSIDEVLEKISLLLARDGR